MSIEPDKRLTLIAAYREAGLHEKADELVQEMLREQGIGLPSDARAKLDQAEKVLDDLCDKLGVPRPSRRKPKRPR